MATAIITPSKKVDVASRMTITWTDGEALSDQFTDAGNGWTKDIKRTRDGYTLTRKVADASDETVAKMTRWLNVTMNTPSTVSVA